MAGLAGAGGDWGPADEALHPRGPGGRWRRKVGIPAALKRALAKIQSGFKEHIFHSNGQAGQWAWNHAKPGRFSGGERRRLLFDWDHANEALFQGETDPETEKFVQMMDRAMIDLPEDVIAHKVVPAEAFGFTPQQMGDGRGPGIADLLGGVVADPGYAMTGLGEPLNPNGGPGSVRMAIAVPKGTRVAFIGSDRNDRNMALDRNQNITITRIEPDGKGGFNMWAVATPPEGAESGPGAALDTRRRGAGLTPEQRAQALTEPTPSTVSTPESRAGAPPPIGAGGQVTQAPAPAPTPDATNQPQASAPTAGGPPPRDGEPIAAESIGGAGPEAGSPSTSDIAQRMDQPTPAPEPVQPAVPQREVPATPHQEALGNVQKRLATKKAHREMRQAIPVAQAMQEIAQLDKQGASNEVKAQHVRGMITDPSMEEMAGPDREKLAQELESVAQDFDRGKQNQARAKLAAIGNRAGLTERDRAGETVDFNPDTMEPVGDTTPTGQVEVIQPSIVHVDDNGRETVISKGRVRSAGGGAAPAAPAAPEVPAAPVKAAKKAAGPQFTPDQERRLIDRAAQWRGQERNDEERRIVAEADKILARRGQQAGPTPVREPRAGRAPMAKKAAPPAKKALTPAQEREVSDLSEQEQRSYRARRNAGRSHEEALQSAQDAVGGREARKAEQANKALAKKAEPKKAVDLLEEQRARKLELAKRQGAKEQAAREKAAERTRLAEEKKAAAARAKEERAAAKAAAPAKVAKKAAPAKDLTPEQQAAAEVQARADEAGLPKTVGELRAAAKEQGIRGFSTMRKEQLQRALLGEEVSTGTTKLQVVSPEKMVGHLGRVDSDSAARTLLDKHTLKDLQALADNLEIDRKERKLSTKDKLKNAILEQVRGTPGTDFEPVSPDEAVSIRDINVPDGPDGDMLRRGLVEVDDTSPESLRDESERLESHATQLRQRGDRVNAALYQEASDRMGMRAQQISGMEEVPKPAKRAPRKAAVPKVKETAAESGARILAAPDEAGAREVLKGKTALELKAIADEVKAPYGSSWTKARIETSIVEHGVRRRLDTDALARFDLTPGTPAKKAAKAAAPNEFDRIREETLRTTGKTPDQLQQEAADRVKVAQAKSKTGKSLIQLQELVNGDASTRAWNSRISSAVSSRGLTRRQADDILEAHKNGNGNEAIDQIARDAGIRLEGTPGSVVPLDRTRHDAEGVSGDGPVLITSPAIVDSDGNVLERGHVVEASPEEAAKLRTAETRATKAVAPGSVPGPRAQAKVTNNERADAFLDAWNKAEIPEKPGRSASRTMAEIRDRVHSGDWSPEEGIRRLEVDIDFNKQDVAEIEAVLRDENLDPAERKELNDKLFNLHADIVHQEKASKFMRGYFRKEPEITPAEAKAALEPEQKSWLDNASPDEIREGARQAGLGEVGGTTAEEVWNNAVKAVVDREMKNREAKKVKAVKAAAKKALPKVEPKLDPEAPDRLDVRQIGTGIDFRTEDRMLLDDVQQRLDAGESPEAIGKSLDGSSAVSPRAQRAIFMDLTDMDNRIHDAQEQKMPADYIRGLEQERVRLKENFDRLEAQMRRQEELGRRLQAMRRPAKKAAPPAPELPGNIEDRKRTISEIVDQGGLSSRPAPTGAQGKTTIETAPDGRKIVRKQFNAGSENKKLADSEELGPLVMDAVGIHAPAVTRIDDRTVAMEFIEGKSGSEIVGHGESVPASILDSDDARRIGLADYLTHSTDRNPGNWIQRPDGGLATVDHADMFLDEKDPHTPPSVPWGLWGDFSGYLRGEDDADGNPTLRPQVDVSKEDLALLRKRLTALRPEFAKRRRLAWHRQLMERLRELDKRSAPGAKSRLVGEAPTASVPAKASRVGPGGSSFPADMPAEERARRVAQIERRQAAKAASPNPNLDGLSDDELRKILASDQFPEAQKDRIRSELAARNAKKETAGVQARLLTKAMQDLEAARTEAQVRDAVKGLTMPELKTVAGKYPLGNVGRSKESITKALVDFHTNRANFEVLTRGGMRDNPIEAGRFSSKEKIPNNWGTQSGEVAFHDDGPVGQALLGLGQDAKLEVDGDSLENVVGKLATRSVRGQISSEQFIQDLKAIQARLPEGKAKQQLGSAIRELDTPKRDPLPLPPGTPAPMVELMQMLSGIPLARDIPRGRRTSAMQELQKIAQELASGERLRGGADTAMEQRLFNTIHESYGAEGKFEIDRAVRRAIDQMRQSRRRPG